MTTEQIHPFRLFERLDWLTQVPLMSVIEPYRRRIFEELLYSFDDEGSRKYTFGLLGRAKKNWKSADLCLSALYMLLVWRSPLGNDCVICSNDHDQARDTLTILKKLVACNPILEREVDVTANAVRRRDGGGTLATVASRETRGLHGGSRLATFYDEVGGFRDSDLFTALAPDPHRARECLTYVTGYRGVHEGPGCPMHDYFERCRTGTLPSDFFSWYDGEFSTDRDFMRDGLTPEERANPSLPSFAPGYLEEAYQRLSAAGYRQVHLNLPSQPSNAAFNVEAVERCMITGVRELPREPGRRYHAWFDGSGGSFADSVLAIAYHDAPSGKAVVARVERQTGEPPFSPTQAIKKFAAILREYGLSRVNGDHWGGNQTRSDWEAEGICYETQLVSASDLYGRLEPRVNAQTVAFVDVPRLRQQLLSVVSRNGKIQPRDGQSLDDHLNAAAGAVWLCRPPPRPEEMTATAPVIVPIDPISPALQSTAGGGYWRFGDAEW